MEGACIGYASDAILDIGLVVIYIPSEFVI